jgi:hypothetical protein
LAVLGRRHLLAGALAGLLAGCSGTPDQGATAPASPASGAPPTTAETARGYTHHRPTGNRLVDGTGALPDADPVDVAVDGPPSWVVGVPAGDDSADSAWAVVAEDGSVTGLGLAGRDVEQFDLAPGALPSGSPPLLLGGDPPRVAEQPTGEASTTTHPVPVDSGWLTVAENGDLVLVDGDGGGEIDRLELRALTDARVVTQEGTAYVLADATDRYRHAVLGDDVEAGSVAVVDVDGGLAERTRIRPPREGVIEGLSAMLADVTGDGTPEVVVTVSNDPGGARLAAYRPDRSRVATSETLSAGWRHQLAVAPFGPDDTPEVAAVRMPHVGHELQFFRRDGEDLQVVGSQDGYQSHTIGSRNLDGALAGDLDGDGSLEVLLPKTARDTLAAVRRTDGGAREAWTVPVGGELSTNVGAVNYDGSVTVAAGHEDGVRFWPG